MSGFDLSKLARAQDEADHARRRAIMRTSRTPDEIRTLFNFALGVAEGEGDTTIVQLVKADGEQVHLVLNPEAKHALVRELTAEPANDALVPEAGELDVT